MEVMDGGFYKLCKVWGRRSEQFSNDLEELFSFLQSVVVTATNMVPTVCSIVREITVVSDIIIIIIIIIQVVITTARGCLTQIPHHNRGQLPGSHLSRNVKEQILNYKSK